MVSGIGKYSLLFTLSEGSLRQSAFVKTPAGKADFDRRSAAKVIAHSERRLVTGLVIAVLIAW
jgi:hypothetical protein